MSEEKQEGLSLHSLRCGSALHSLFSPITLQLNPGQWLMLSGKNGAGKSTFLRVLAGFLPAIEGVAKWRGSPISFQDASWHGSCLYQGHKQAWKEALTAWENLYFQATLDASLSEENGEALLWEGLQYVGLKSKARRFLGRHSAGERQKLSLARLFLSTHSLWLLDEPLVSLDASGVKLFTELLDRLLERGGIAVVATHQEIFSSNPPLRLNLTMDSL